MFQIPKKKSILEHAFLSVAIPAACHVPLNVLDFISAIYLPYLPLKKLEEKLKIKVLTIKIQLFHNLKNGKI